MKENKIPKVIHYCWFGGNPMPDNVLECIKSWKKYLPDYEIKRWDETNYDINKCLFIKEAYQQKKWAFVSDYARLDIIYNNGGIYLDTDVEIIKNIDQLLLNEAFMGFETSMCIATGLGFGAKKGNKIIKENLEFYNNLQFINKDGTLNTITCPSITTSILKKYGLKTNNKLQKIKNITIYPSEYFCPINYYNGDKNITNNTYSIHHYSMSWIDKKFQKQNNKRQKLAKIIGYNNAKKIFQIINLPSKIKNRIKNHGIKYTFNFYLSKLKRK